MLLIGTCFFLLTIVPVLVFKGLKVRLCPSLFEENLDPKSFRSFSEFVEETAFQKALEVENRLKREGEQVDVVIAADTMVTLDREMFGKPTSEDDAFDMLSR